MDFQDQVVLVTGASRGLGAAIATAFAAEGATVIANYLSNEQAAATVVDECKSLGGNAMALQADITAPESVQQLIDGALEAAGKIDVLVNNAFRPYLFDPQQRKPFWSLEWQDYQSQIDGSVRSTYSVCSAVLPAMQARSQGSIVNIASDLIYRPTIPYHDYTTAKAALVGFSQNLAMELGPLGIRVNCVAPGLIDTTEASRTTKEALKESIIAQTPMRRIASPKDVAGAVLFLASPWSSFVTGQVLTVDGGLIMR